MKAEIIAITKPSETVTEDDLALAGHANVTILFKGIPQILAMMLSNEKHSTTEKYGLLEDIERFHPDISYIERELYNKWCTIFEVKIRLLYPDIPKNQLKRLVQENARLLLSVFTPVTAVAHTATIRQYNYYLNWAEKFTEQEIIACPSGCPYDFNEMLSPILTDFVRRVSPLIDIFELNDHSDREFSFFARDERNEEWGENYCINYQGTFAHVARILRRHALNFEIKIPISKPKFYVPELLRDTPFEQKWLCDISELTRYYPLGMIVDINERGTVEDFLLKLQAQFCGYAPAEICKTTQANLKRYYEALAPKAEVIIDDTSVASFSANKRRQRYDEIRKNLAKFVDKPVCHFDGLGYLCRETCYCGAEHIFDRQV